MSSKISTKKYKGPNRSRVQNHSGSKELSDLGFFRRCLARIACNNDLIDRDYYIMDAWGGKRQHQKRIKYWGVLYFELHHFSLIESECKIFFGPRFVKLYYTKDLDLCVVLMRDKKLNPNLHQQKQLLDLTNI